MCVYVYITFNYIVFYFTNYKSNKEELYPFPC